MGTSSGASALVILLIRTRTRTHGLLQR